MTVIVVVVAGGGFVVSDSFKMDSWNDSMSMRSVSSMCALIAKKCFSFAGGTLVRFHA